MGEVDPSPALLAGRYRLGARLGAGSRGEVFAARDTVAGVEVAIKLLDPVDRDERRRVLREIAALRALQMPGVVPLRDEGRIGARHFIVMDRIHGAPFPGAGGHASAVAIERIAGLLAVLDRVHGLGIVHRDLKPANVLVDGDGAVVVLDFGLARGPSLGATMTASGAAVGTPRYQAPEQMRGLAVDARADLYAVGVMAFAALAGRAPHPADSLPLLMRARLMEPAPSLADAAPHVPPAVAALVQRLLARDPADRPPTAADALAALRGEGARAEWPWLGSRAPIEAIVERIEGGRRCAVGGPRRSGRSRAIHEAARLLGAERPVVRLVPGERPFASLGGVVDPSALAGSGPLPARVRAELELRLLGGAVLVADEGLDRWTARIVGALAGRVLTVVPPGAPADVVLGPVTARALHPLFVGPDRLFHLVEDPAAALVERAGGLRGDVIEALTGWVADGVARRVDERLAVDRAAMQQALARPRAITGGLDVQGALADVVTAAHLAWPHTTAADLALALDRPTWEVELAVLELLEQGALAARPGERYEPRAPASTLPAWSEARQVGLHARMAASLPMGAEGRLGHLLAGSDPPAITEEALYCAARAEREGRRADGIGVLGEALKAVEREASAVGDASGLVWRLLAAMARLALTEDGRSNIGVVRAELARLRIPARWAGESVAPERLDRLLALMAAVGGAEAAVIRAEVEAMPPFADDPFELARLNLLATAAIYESPEASARTLDAIAPWFAARSPGLRARLSGWRGNLLYRQGRFADAAALHLEAAGQRADAPGRLGCLANAGFALLEAFEFERAEAVARRLVDEATPRRLATLEAMGERIIRAVAYRTGRAEAPDGALVDAAAGLRHVTLAAAIALNEGAIAWRAGDREQACAHAETAAERARRSGQQVIARLAEGLRMLACPPPVAEVEAFADRVLGDPGISGLPRVAAQLIGVARRCHPSPPRSWLAAALRGAGTVPAARWTHPLELLSLAESVASGGTPSRRRGRARSPTDPMLPSQRELARGSHLAAGASTTGWKEPPMIVSMPPLRIFWPSNNAYEIDHGSMEMPRAGQSLARSAAYSLGGGPAGFAEEHIEHWTASTTGFTDVGKTEIGSNDGSTNKSRSGFIDWLSNNPTLAVQYAHRRVFRFANVDGTDSSGNSVVPDPDVAADDLITIKRGGAIYAYGLRTHSTTGARVVWKLSQDLLAGHVYDFETPASAQGMTAQQFIDNKSGDPGHLSTVAHAYYEDVADFPGGPGTGGSNVPSD